MEVILRCLLHKIRTGVGILITSPNKNLKKFKYRIEDSCSNNEAEYEALMAGLKILLDLGEKRVEVKGNSELVVKKIMKEYICIKENLIIYFVISNIIIKCFDFVEIQHVPRLENQKANDLAQIAQGTKCQRKI